MRLEQGLIIDVPNVNQIQNYGVTTQAFFHIGHLWYFSPATITAFLAKAGLKIEFLAPRGAALILVAMKSKESTLDYKIQDMRTNYEQVVYALNVSNSSNINL